MKPRPPTTLIIGLTTAAVIIIITAAAWQITSLIDEACPEPFSVACDGEGHFSYYWESGVISSDNYPTHEQALQAAEKSRIFSAEYDRTYEAKQKASRLRAERFNPCAEEGDE